MTPIGSSGSLFDRTVSFKIEFKGVLIDLDMCVDLSWKPKRSLAFEM